MPLETRLTSEALARDDIIVIDDFYDAPHRVREIALAARYTGRLRGAYRGEDSRERWLAAGQLERIAGLLASPLFYAESLCTGRFRAAFEGDEPRHHIHVDAQSCLVVAQEDWIDYSALIYLSLPEHARGGTSFWRHRDTGWLRCAPASELARHGLELQRDFHLDQGHDTTRWEPWQRIDMRFNRLVLFRADLWHSADPGFGRTRAEARLTQNFPFIAGEPPATLRHRTDIVVVRPEPAR